MTTTPQDDTGAQSAPDAYEPSELDGRTYDEFPERVV